MMSQSIEGARGGASECQGDKYQYVGKVSKYYHLIVSYKNITYMFRGSHQHALKLRAMVELDLEQELDLEKKIDLEEEIDLEQKIDLEEEL